MISQVIHKPNIGNAPAAIYEYTATVMCWGSWQTMAAWYTMTAKGVTLYHVCPTVFLPEYSFITYINRELLFLIEGV